MAIRDRFRRAMRKSDDSSDVISQTESNTTATTVDSSDSSSNKSNGSRLAKTFSLGLRDRSKDEEKQARKNKKLHPSQRPLTLQNLKHQEMLSHFTMTFGASDPSQVEGVSFVGVSPCCTRAPSMEIDRADVSPLLTGTPSSVSGRD